MLTLRLYFTQLRKQYLALKLKWENDKAIGRTRSRWKQAMRKGYPPLAAPLPAPPHKPPTA
jgi:hypothetical protein